MFIKGYLFKGYLRSRLLSDHIGGNYLSEERIQLNYFRSCQYSFCFLGSFWPSFVKVQRSAGIRNAGSCQI